MNYRHAFHAGNFADVMKHLTLVRVIEYLKRKDKPFCVVDTHAGAGLYDLAGNEAQRSGEWHHGIARLVGAGWQLQGSPAPQVSELVQPYLDALAAVNLPGAADGDATLMPAPSQLRYYPGSGLIAQHLMRAGDRLVLNELHEEDAESLALAVGRDRRVRTLQLDGWTVVRSVLPPKERRGVLLIDPPFELAGEFNRLEQALADAVERFATGVTLLWYPIKAGGTAEAFLRRMRKSGHARLLSVELLVRHREAVHGLNGSGLLIHNPPYGLDTEIERLLPWLMDRMQLQVGAASRVEWLSGE